jgi:hypothetical protein
MNIRTEKVLLFISIICFVPPPAFHEISEFFKPPGHKKIFAFYKHLNWRKETNPHNTRTEVLTAMLLKIIVFWDVTLPRLARGYRFFFLDEHFAFTSLVKADQVLSQPLFFDCLTLKTKVLKSFKT